MSYDLESSQLFQDQFRLLPKGQERLVQSKIDVLEHDPRPLGKNKKALAGSKDPNAFALEPGATGLSIPLPATQCSSGTSTSAPKCM